ncbi:chaplin [Streptomyces fulvoviolaceus]|uniref:chaplin n=1 Tax=Streptomyces fulvoviolaceus TaxID=285535 RepID=UPI0004CBD98B|nr:chaplin family protein [Streptomyces fulvoviolaceus]MCT9075829.1 chaplin family protein [Streptomyces fulvoviolaceus]
MRRVTRNGVLAVAAVSGAMAVTAPVYADSAADGATAGSPGVISGNTIQLPVHVPVNVCGNTVNVVGILNPAAGNTCVNEDSVGDGASAPGGATSDGGATAQGGGKDSPGVISGNGVQLPVHLPVNVSGNSVSVVGVGNAAVGNESVNTSGDQPVGPDRPAKPSAPPKGHPAPQPVPHPQPDTAAALAHTGTDQTLPAVIGSTALVLGGAALYRRYRPRAVR